MWNIRLFTIYPFIWINSFSSTASDKLLYFITQWHKMVLFYNTYNQNHSLKDLKSEKNTSLNVISNPNHKITKVIFFNHDFKSNDSKSFSTLGQHQLAAIRLQFGLTRRRMYVHSELNTDSTDLYASLFGILNRRCFTFDINHWINCAGQIRCSVPRTFITNLCSFFSSNGGSSRSETRNKDAN